MRRVTAKRPTRGIVELGLAALGLAFLGPAPINAGEPVTFGGPELVSGIPGEGPLTAEQIDAWLADPVNHTELRPRLPLGLAAGAKDIAVPEDNPLTRAKIELGRQLFFDPRLSSDGSVSCASCHQPEHGYAAPTRFGIGVGEQEGTRNSPAAYNRILSRRQFWDGRAESLEQQAVGPIASAIEMGNTHEAAIDSLQQVPGYRRQFERIFDDGLTIDNVGRALASFERALVTSPSPWDHHERLARFEKAYAEDLEDPEYLADEDPELLEEHEQLKAAAADHPMEELAVEGAALFFSQRIGCSQCHVGANFTDEKYHNLGVGYSDTGAASDLGRFDTTGEDQDRGAFKTPTLRNVALTPPYMHDGSQPTLAAVLDFYWRGGRPNPHLSDKIKPIKVDGRDQAALVAFLNSLTGSLPEVEQGRLPE